jgi:hypothetical protein
MPPKKSAFGGKSENICSFRALPLLTQRRHGHHTAIAIAKWR